MDGNFEIRYGRIFDDVRYNLDRSTTRVKVVEFMIGNSGPFTVKVDDGPNWNLEVTQQIEALRATMRTLPQ